MPSLQSAPAAHGIQAETSDFKYVPEEQFAQLSHSEHELIKINYLKYIKMNKLLSFHYLIIRTNPQIYWD